MLKTFVNGRVEGFLFSTASGRPLTQRNVLRDGFGKIEAKPGSGSGWHGLSCLPSFPHSTLEKKPCAVELEKFWLGHANKNVTDKHSEQLKTDVEWRKEVAEYTGLGFKPPTVESSVGLLGLPKSTKTEKIGVEQSRLTD